MYHLAHTLDIITYIGYAVKHMEYLSLGQFAKKTGLSRGRIQQLCTKGYIRRDTVNKFVQMPMIPETELQKFTGSELDTRSPKSTRKVAVL
jgi:hypothetical protein